MEQIDASAVLTRLTPSREDAAGPVAEIVGELTQGLSVHVTGMPGSGRSTVLRGVAEELSLSGIATVTVRGEGLLADRPLAALLRAGLPVDAGMAGGVSLMATVAAFEELVDRSSTVVIIDDAEELDAASAGVIIAARADLGFRMVVASRTAIETPGPLDELVAAAQPGVEVTLHALSMEQLHQLIHGMLPGVVDPGTVSRIAALSGGLPSLARAITDVGRRAGLLVLRDGMWRSGKSLWDDRLRFTLRPLLVGLRPGELDVLAQVAIAGNVTWKQASERVDPAILRRLVQLGLVRSDRGFPQPVVGVFPLALAEMLSRASGAPAQAGSLTDSDGQREVELNAAVFVNRVFTHWRKEIDLRWARWEADRVPANAVPLLTALRSGAADYRQVRVVLDKTKLDASDPAELTAFVALSAKYTAIWCHDLPKALAELDQHAKQFPQHESYVRAFKGHSILMCERVPDLSVYEPRRGDGYPPGDELLRAGHAEALLAAGRTDDAAAMLASFTPATARAESVVEVLYGLLKVLGDDVAGGVEWGLAHLADAMEMLEPGQIAAHAYVAVLGSAMQGRFDEMDSLMDVAFRMADSDTLQSHYQAGLFFLASIIATWQDRREYAHRLATQAQSLGAKHGPFPGMFGALDRLSDQQATADELWDLVDDQLERGYLVNAVFLAVAAVELAPTVPRASAVVTQGMKSQSRVLRTLCSYIQTVVDQDLDKLTEVIDELREVCGPFDAMRAGITRALLLREAGDAAGWLAQASASWREGDGLGKHCLGLFSRLVKAVDLTQREAEVVVPAAQGRSSAEIASLLGLSKRTAETYLSSAYKKTGVRNRPELHEAITTWLVV